MPSNDPWDLGGGGDSFQFDTIGAAVEGFVVDMIDRQGTEIDTGEPAWWDDAKTRPKMLKIVTLQTERKDNPSDDGRRNVTLAGSKTPWPDGGKSKYCAVFTAVKEATGGQTAIRLNGWLRIEMVGFGPKTKPAYSPPKYFEAWYRPPVMDLDGPDRTPPNNQLPQTYGTPNTTTNVYNQQQPGANWPAAGQQSPPPEWQPQQQQLPPEQPPVASGGTLAGEPITQAAVEAIRKAGMNPDTVWGPGWQARVSG